MTIENEKDIKKELKQLDLEKDVYLDGYKHKKKELDYKLFKARDYKLSKEYVQNLIEFGSIHMIGTSFMIYVLDDIL